MNERNNELTSERANERANERTNDRTNISSLVGQKKNISVNHSVTSEYLKQTLAVWRFDAES